MTIGQILRDADAGLILSPTGASVFWPIALGAFAFLLVVGPKCLILTNIAWLGSGDPSTHYLGWAFFRNSPWAFPVGANPAYGLDFGSSIVFSDSNPLLAIPFKLFSPLLPADFQYFGLWILACFMLQAWFGWKLIGLVSGHSLIRLLGAGLFVFSPPMLWRLHGHLSLCGHFLILAALFFALEPADRRRKFIWATILSFAVLVHAYLFLMTGLLWLASLAESLLHAKQSARRALLEFGSILSILVLVSWQAGYFEVGRGLDGEGYGVYRMNLLSIFDSNGWSYVLADFRGGKGDYEGFNFLGLGLLLLLVDVIPIACKSGSMLKGLVRRYPFMVLVMLLLSSLAITNNIGVGTFNWVVPLPKSIIHALSIFRGSGRLFWVVYYGIVLLSIYLLARTKSPRVVIATLSTILVFQIVDTSRGWRPIRWKLMAEPKSALSNPLKGPFWDQAAKHYSFVRLLPPENFGDNYLTVASYAASHGLSTDAVYLARVDGAAFERRQKEAMKEMIEGLYRPDTLYIVNDSAMELSAFRYDPGVDLLVRLNGLNVLAPGWKRCIPCARAF